MNEQTFTKADRLRKRPEFIEISKMGRRVQNAHAIILYRSGRHKRPRLGITVTKRVGNAVIRSRIKRLFREYFRHNREKLETNLDINIIAKKAAAGLTSAEIFTSLESLFQKIEINGACKKNLSCTH